MQQVSQEGYPLCLYFVCKANLSVHSENFLL